jgi:hypothetical protein
MLQSFNKSSFYLINLCKEGKEKKRENLEFSMHEGTIIAAIFLSFSSETLASNRNKKETRMKGKRKKGNNKKRKLHATGNIYEA